MDRWLFYSQNQWAGWGYWTDYFAWFLAVWGLGILAALLLLRWFFPGADPRRERQTVLLAVAAAIIAVGLNELPELFLYRERPYMSLPEAFNLLGGKPSSSFPSEHGTGGFALALVMSWESRLWGWLSWPVALGMAWARVYAGAHYPSDMLAAFVISFLAAGLLLGLRGELEPALDRVLKALPGNRT
ncbi:MAG: phosphatase PAP2 family protein [Bacillota bacterium]